MILTYDIALERSSNKDWFKATYKKSDLASDDDVLKINELVKKVGTDKLDEYLEMKDDTILQAEYVEDLIDYLMECAENM